MTQPQLSDNEPDALLLAAANSRWQKVAMVIVKAMAPFTTWSSWRVDQRVKALVRAGKLESMGNVRKWRRSEVRLSPQSDRRMLAIQAKARALKAISTLHSILDSEADWTEEDRELLKRGVGLSIGTIEVDLLSVIYKSYPDLDELRNK